MPHPYVRPREVDVVVRSTNGGQPYILSVEAAGRKRKATVEWVEQLVQKHSRLETSQLVLVAEAGFSEDARGLAIAEGALPIAPEDMRGGDPTFSVVNNLQSVWGKVVSITPAGGVIYVEHPIKGRVVMENPWNAETPVYIDTDEPVGTLANVIALVAGEHCRVRSTSDYTRDRSENDNSLVAFKVDPITAARDGVAVTFRLPISVDDEQPQLLPIVAVQLDAEQTLTVIEGPLTHRRFQKVLTSYTSIKAKGKEARFIATVVDGVQEMSIRARYPSSSARFLAE